MLSTRGKNMLRSMHMEQLHSVCGHTSHPFLVATQRPLSLLLQNGRVNAADSSGLMTSAPATATTSLHTTVAVLIDAAWRGRRSSALKRQRSRAFDKQRGADVAFPAGLADNGAAVAAATAPHANVWRAKQSASQYYRAFTAEPSPCTADLDLKEATASFSCQTAVSHHQLHP